METSNYLSPYTLAYLSLAKYQFAYKFGESAKEIEALEQLLLLKHDEQTMEENWLKTSKVLNKELVISSLRSLFELYLKNRQYGDAKEVFEELEEVDAQASAVYEKAMERIISLQNDGQTFSSDVQIGARGYTFLYLLKRGFMFSDIQGSLDTFKLRCRSKFASLEYQPQAQYHLPKRWGKCHLQIIGSEGTRAKLIQF